MIYYTNVLLSFAQIIGEMFRIANDGPRNKSVSIDEILVEFIIIVIARHIAVGFIWIVIEIETTDGGESFIEDSHNPYSIMIYLWNAD
jgi:hypothetical protein